MGAAYSCKKYNKCASPKIRKLADNMSLKSLRDFASTKNKDLPETVHFKNHNSMLEGFALFLEMDEKIN
jgi:hypothetical protein